jgi:hypothetical protein
MSFYEPYPDPPIGVTVWHKTREEFGKVTGFTSDPTSIILDFGDEELEVSRHLLERSIFQEGNEVRHERK